MARLNTSVARLAAVQSPHREGRLIPGLARPAARGPHTPRDGRAGAPDAGVCAVTTAEVEAIRAFAAALRAFVKLAADRSKVGRYVWANEAADDADALLGKLKNARGPALSAASKVHSDFAQIRSLLDRAVDSCKNHRYEETTVSPPMAHQRLDNHANGCLKEIDDLITAAVGRVGDPENTDEGNAPRQADNQTDKQKKPKKPPMPRNLRELKTVHRRVVKAQKQGETREQAVREYVEETGSSRNSVGVFHCFGRVQVRILSRR
jgi:hypothetical protein